MYTLICKDEGDFLYKILLVDDSDLSRKIVKTALEQNEYQVICAKNGPEAVECVKSVNDIDLILMDIELESGKDGIDTAKEILRIKNLPITFLTANSSKEILEKIEGLGNYGYISKGIEKYAFLSSVQSAINLFNSVSEAKFYQSIYENASEEIYIFDFEKNEILSVNNSACENLNYSKFDLSGASIFKVMPELEHEIKNMFNNLKEGKNEIKFNQKNKRKDSTLYFTENKISLTFYKSRSIGVIVSTDVTEKKRLEKEKEENQKRLNAMIEGVPSPALLVSKDNIIMNQNKAAEINFEFGIGMTFDSSILDEQTFSKKDLSEEKINTEQKNHEKEAHNNSKEIFYKSRYWNLHIIKLGEDNLYYFVDVTEYKEMENKLFEMAIKDELTGTFNRRYFTNKLKEETERSKRTGRAFSIIMLDLDDFKLINDKYGHCIGDVVLKSVVNSINDRLRKIDLLARWGGEEFMIILPETNIDNARFVANSILEKVSNIKIGNIPKVTASIGISEFNLSEDFKTLIKRADDKMYEAKRSGKNCAKS